MKILTFLSTYLPHSYGGGEASAIHLADWLSKQGHDTAFLTSASKGEQELHGEKVGGHKVWRYFFPRQYTFWQQSGPNKWQKALWHLQDHFDPRNRRLVAKALDTFEPDIALVHVVSGMGYNSLKELSKRKIPTIYFMHDLNIVCGKGGLFKNGQDCTKRCGLCKIISHIRLASILSVPNIMFCSPSRANLEKAAQYVDLNARNSISILNANTYPKPQTVSRFSGHVRFLYVGRLHPTKGIDVLLSALEKLAQRYSFSLVVVGSGPEEETLKKRFGHHAWCQFVGHVSEQGVSDYMGQSDLLCIPSIWLENSPGVVINAQLQGLPVMGSQKGGIPELVLDGETGLLVPPSDIGAWTEALEKVLVRPEVLQDWRKNAECKAKRFEQDVIGNQFLALIDQVVGGHK